MRSTNPSLVLPLSVVENSDYSANRLTTLVTPLILAAQGSSSCFPFETTRMMMALHVFVFVFLLVVCLFLSLALFWRRDWFHRRPSHSRGGAKRTTAQRLRHRPAAQTIAPPVVSPSLPVWVVGQLFSLAPEHKPWRMYSSIRSDRAWLLAASRSSPVTGSISTSMRLSAHFGQW